MPELCSMSLPNWCRYVSCLQVDIGTRLRINTERFEPGVVVVKFHEPEICCASYAAFELCQLIYFQQETVACCPLKSVICAGLAPWRA